MQISERLIADGTQIALPRASHADATRYLLERGVSKSVFGLPLPEAAYTYTIPKDGMRYISDDRLGLHEATALSQLSSPFYQESVFPVLSLFDGIGNTAWCLSQAFPLNQIIAVERDWYRHKMSRENVNKLELAEQIDTVEANVDGYLEKAISKHKSFRAIFLDPPWFDDGEAIATPSLQEVNSNYEDFILKATQLAPVVAFRIPFDTSRFSIKEIGRQVDRETIVHSHIHRTTKGDRFGTKTVYLVDGERKGLKELSFVMSEGGTEWQEEFTF